MSENLERSGPTRVFPSFSYSFWKVRDVFVNTVTLRWCGMICGSAKRRVMMVRQCPQRSSLNLASRGVEGVTSSELLKVDQISDVRAIEVLSWLTGFQKETQGTSSQSHPQPYVIAAHHINLQRQSGDSQCREIVLCTDDYWNDKQKADPRNDGNIPLGIVTWVQWVSLFPGRWKSPKLINLVQRNHIMHDSLKFVRAEGEIGCRKSSALSQLELWRSHLSATSPSPRDETNPKYNSTWTFWRHWWPPTETDWTLCVQIWLERGDFLAFLGFRIMEGAGTELEPETGPVGTILQEATVEPEPFSLFFFFLFWIRSKFCSNSTDMQRQTPLASGTV